MLLCVVYVYVLCVVLTVGETDPLTSYANKNLESWILNLVITRLIIGHTKTTKAHILSRGPPITCRQCGQILASDHVLLKCAMLQEIRNEYYTADSVNTILRQSPAWHSRISARSGILLSDFNKLTFYTIFHLNHPRTDAGFLTSTSTQTWTL